MTTHSMRLIEDARPTYSTVAWLLAPTIVRDRARRWLTLGTETLAKSWYAPEGARLELFTVAPASSLLRLNVEQDRK